MSSSKTVAVRPLDEVAIQEIQDLADSHAVQALKDFQPLQRALKQAAGIKALREAIQPLMASLEPLMGTPLGFDTDRGPNKKDKTPYPMETVRDIIVEALLRGLSLTGNEFTCLVGKCYTNLNGYKRLVETKLPGLTDLEIATSPPYVKAGHTCVLCRAAWKLNGNAMCLRDHRSNPSVEFAIPTHAGTGADAIIGKARRRIYKGIWELCTGSVFTEPTVDEEVPALAAPANIEPPKTQTQAVLDAVEQSKRSGTVVFQEEPPKSYLVNADQAANIATLRHLVPDEEFNLWLEQYGVFEIAQLKNDTADAIIERLRSIQRGQRS